MLIIHNILRYLELLLKTLHKMFFFFSWPEWKISNFWKFLKNLKISNKILKIPGTNLEYKNIYIKINVFFCHEKIFVIEIPRKCCFEYSFISQVIYSWFLNSVFNFSPRVFKQFYLYELLERARWVTHEYHMEIILIHNSGKKVQQLLHKNMINEYTNEQTNKHDIYI